MTPDELATIKARLDAPHAPLTCNRNCQHLAHHDVPRLVAEVRRLAADMDDLTSLIHDERIQHQRAIDKRDQLAADLPRVQDERDRARSTAVRLEQENAHLVEVHRGEVESLKVELAKARRMLDRLGTRADKADAAIGRVRELCHNALTRAATQDDVWQDIEDPTPIPGWVTLVQRALGAAPDVWVIPRVPYDPDAAVTPRIRPGGRITRAAGDDDPTTLRAYAAKCLAAADAAEAAQDGGER